MWWFHEVVPGQYAPSAQLFSKCVYKVLFLANHEEYFNVDGWPAENDRQLYYRVTAEIPLLQASLTHAIWFIGTHWHTICTK